MVQEHAGTRPGARSPLDQPTPDRNRLPWRDIAQRGSTLGVAVALHLSLLAWILALAPTPDAKSTDNDGEPIRDDALHLAFLHPPTATPAAHIAMSHRLLPRPRAVATHPRISPPAVQAVQASPNPPMPIDLSPAPGDAAAIYHPGSFRSDLKEARHPKPAFRMPGFTVTSVPGIRLRAPAPSVKQIVQLIGKSQACYAVYTGITHGMARFLTPDQIDSKMEAEGCGPQASKEDNDPTVNAIAHDFVTGH